ncbi:MAG: 6,7-dimethyl-8-ribityllumazine synthase [Planctomycetota bacterium]|nr:MAG: 6,7-dimethyl-8-ribityllumazine synthase [Planctomycetota bacterium]
MPAVPEGCRVFDGRNGDINGRYAVVVSRFNDRITGGLLDGALSTLMEKGIPADSIDIYWVPGAFELPTVAGELVRRADHVAVLCLGAVIRGETTHDQHINRAVSREIARLGAESGIPVLFGVLTCNTLEQAIARSVPVKGTAGKDRPDARIGNKGAECAEAAVEMVGLLRSIRNK